MRALSLEEKSVSYSTSFIFTASSFYVYVQGWTCGGQRTTCGESVVFPACRSQGLDSGLQIWQLAPLPSEPSHLTASIFKKTF